MRKLKLRLDTLAVESFATAAAEGAGGTVHGAAGAPAAALPPTSCKECMSGESLCPALSCGSTCDVHTHPLPAEPSPAGPGA